MKKIDQIFQGLIKLFTKANKRFPAGKELDDLEQQAQKLFIEESTESTPTFSVVDERKLPKAGIEALPSKDPNLREQAVQKKLAAQNVQAKQSIEGGESSGGQRGAPELVTPNFGDTVYIDKADMMARMDQAYRFVEQAEDALSRGDLDEVRAILRYEIEENYKMPNNVRNAAADARYMIKRGEGIDWREQGFESLEEAQEELRDKINNVYKQTREENFPQYTDPLEGEPQSVEYVSFFDEPGEDFGTPNSRIADIDDYDFKSGGLVKRKQKKNGGLSYLLGM